MRVREHTRELSRKLLRAPKSEERDRSIRAMIRQIPRGKVATYSQVAAAAGYPMYHRQVVQVLRKAGGSLPWQRVVGVGGKICTMQDHGLEQSLRLKKDGVEFRGVKVRMDLHQHVFEY